MDGDRDKPDTIRKAFNHARTDLGAFTLPDKCA
jgi:hypothetical protein